MGVLLVCMSVYHMCTSCLWRPEEGVRSLGTRNTVNQVMWVLETEPESSVRATNTLNCLAISLAGYGCVLTLHQIKVIPVLIFVYPSIIMLFREDKAFALNLAS